MTEEEQRAASLEQRRRHCVHHDGRAIINNGLCRAGLNPAVYGQTYKQRPCLDGHLRKTVDCFKWQRPTEEDVAKEYEESRAHLEKVMAGLSAAAKWRVKPKPKEDRQGVVECPVCKGNLHLSQSSYNGHVWGKCETPQCVTWME